MPTEPKPIVPPMRLPVAEYKTPSPDVVFYTEFVSREDPAYVQNSPVKRGTLYSSMIGAKQQVIDAYPNLYFLGERKFRLDDTLVFWDWATVPNAEDTYNAEVQYVSDSVDHPAFTRVYTIRRDVYDAAPALVEGSLLTALIGVVIVDGGQDYTSATGTIDNTDVAIQFVIQDGVIVSGVITNEGTGILSTSQIVVTGDGAGAVVTPIVQATNTYLISQKKQEIGGDDPLKNEFVRVIRVYETLPGVYIKTTKVDKYGDTVTTIRRHNLQTNIDAITPRETLVAGVWTQISSEPVNDSYFVGWEIQESQDIPTNFVKSTRYRSDGSIITTNKRLQDTTLIVSDGNISGGILTLTSSNEVSDLVSEEVREASLVPGPTIHGEHVDERNGIVIDIEKTIVPDGTAGGIIGDAYVEVRPHDKWQSIQIASTLDPDSLPEDTQWYGSVQRSFPPELTDAVIDWAFAECGCSFSFSAVLLANFNQYSGQVKTRITEQFYNGPPPDDVTITQFFPQAHHFGFAWASTCGDTDGNCRTKSGAPTFYIPLCLHDDLSLSVGANTWTFSATSPAVLPHGTYIMLAPHVERWRFGVFRRVLTEVFIP